MLENLYPEGKKILGDVSFLRRATYEEWRVIVGAKKPHSVGSGWLEL